MKITVEFGSLEEMQEFLKKTKVSDFSNCEEKTVREEYPQEEKNVPEEEKQVLAKETNPKEPAQENVPRTYTMIDVRTKLSELTKAGKKEQVKALLQSFGVDRLSKIPEDKYTEVMEKAGEIACTQN